MAIKKIKKSKYNLSPSMQKTCHGIIHSASGSAAAVAAGLAQLPLADNAVITPIQITMIISLGKVFEQEITKTVAKSLLGGFIGNLVGRGVAQAAWGWIPGIGNASNAITAAAITESIGWLCVDHFYKERYLDAVGSNKAAENDVSSIFGDIFGDINKEPNMDDTNRNDTDKMVIKQKELKDSCEEFFSEKKTIEKNIKEYLDLLDALLEYIQEMKDESDGRDELIEYYNKLEALK